MKRINNFLIMISIIMLILILGNILMLSSMKATIELGSSIKEWRGMVVAAFLIIIGLSHLLGLINLVLQYRYFRNENFMRAATFVIGIFSMFLLAVDVTMLNDIGHEYMFGYDISEEWQIVFSGHAVHVLFAVSLLFQTVTGNRVLRMSSKTTVPVKDESLFLTVHQIGIISAVLGLINIIILSKSGVPQKYFSGLLFVLCMVFLISYGLAATYWLFTKRKDKPTEWYDEKQFVDISRGALITLVFSVLVNIVFYFLTSCKIIDSCTDIWFPSYILLTLLVFSGSTLFLSKKA
jgi:hypothetical protein